MEICRRNPQTNGSHMMNTCDAQGLKSPTRLDTSLLEFELRDPLVQCESVVVHSSGYGEARRAIQESDTLCSSHRSCASRPVTIDQSGSESTCCNVQPRDHTLQYARRLHDHVCIHSFRSDWKHALSVQILRARSGLDHSPICPPKLYHASRPDTIHATSLLLSNLVFPRP